MTLNNLADHLSWLLSHVDLCRPTGPVLPTVNDTVFDPARSFTSTIASQPAAANSVRQGNIANNNNNDASRPPNASRATATSQPDWEFDLAAIDDDDPFADEEEEIASRQRRKDAEDVDLFADEEEELAAWDTTSGTTITTAKAVMGKLTTKPTKKPSLISKQDHLPTPPPTTAVGKLQQAYTASLSSKNGKLQQAYSASLSNNSSRSGGNTPPPKKASSPSRLSRTPSWISRPKGPARHEVADDDADEDMYDITEVDELMDPDATGCTTYVYGSPIPLWNEDAASRAEPPSSRGKKRKSSEMLGSSPRLESMSKSKGSAKAKTKPKPKPKPDVKGEDDDEFPDVFDLVGEDLKTPAMIERRKARFPSASRRSPLKGSPPKLNMAASDITTLTQRTITHTRSTTETTVRRTASRDRTPYRSSSATSMVESPSGKGKTAALPPPEPFKRPRTSSTAKSRAKQRSPSPMAIDEEFSMSDGGVFDQPKSPSPKPSRPVGRFKRSDIIMDSDDDDDFDNSFETPPTRNDSDAVSFFTAGTGGAGPSSREEGPDEPKQAAAAIPAKRQPSWIDDDSSQPLGEGNVQPVGRAPTQGSDAAKPSQLGDFDPANEQRSSASTDDGTLIMDLFKGHSHALDVLERPILDKLAQNTSDLVRALREKWPVERRNEIKLARLPLVKQKEAFAEARAAFTTYRELDGKSEDLLAEVMMAYDADLDTGEAEAHHEALSKEIDESERSLRRALIATGLTVESFNDLPDPPPQQQANVTLATTAARSLSRASSFIPECASQNIPQSQSGSRPPSRAVSSEQPPAPTRPPVPPFPREQMPTARPFPPPSNRTFANPPRANSKDLNMDVEDFFDDDDDDWIHPGVFQPRSNAPPAARASTSTRTRPKSPARPKSRPQDNFSDYGNSDDEDLAAMVAMAEDAEVGRRPSPANSRSNRSRERSVLSEASGNSAPTLRAKAVTKKPAVPKLKVPPELMQHRWSKDLLLAFKDRFRLTSFRHNQLEAINATLDGQDAFVLMPTGGGKSLCYQLPAVIHSGQTKGVTIVVTPLLSLMQDQVDHLRALGIAAKAFNGDMDRAEKQDILNSFKMRSPELHVQLLYVTPEMINKSTAFLNGLQTLHRNKKFARLVIDEAHCVSQWGHDFRPDYKELGQVRQQFPGVPVIALTATATLNVITDVKHNLSMQNCKVFSQSFNRANLYYEVRPKEKQSVETIANLITEKYAGKTGIVYTLSRKQTEQIAQKLCDHGISAKHYHAAMPAADKTQVQRDWQSGRVKVVVATIAFGMGIDKPDVRFVVHQYLPKSLEGYYQETGRAGRDGSPSDCYLFFSHGDISQLRKFIEDSDGNWQQKDRQKEMLNRVVMFCENTRDCRRSQLLHYFGETFANTKCRKTCDNCKNAFHHETEDRTEIAKAVLEAVMYYSRLTMIQCTDALLGKKKDKDEELQPFHGAGKRLKKYEIFRIINSLAAEHALGEENRMGGHGIAIQYFIMGKNASQFLNGERKLMMVVQRGNDKSAPAKPTRKKATKKAAADPASTCISSPVRGGARTRKKGKAVAAKYFDVEAIAEDDDEVDKEDFSSRVARFANGYAQDGFAVDDDDDEDDYFEPRVAAPPPKQRRQRTLEEQLAPQASAVAPQVAEPDEIQSLILEEFMRDAKRLEEELRNSHNIRTPLFTEVQLQQMLILWANSTAEMGRIQGIKEVNVRKFGPKLIPLVDRYHTMYRDMFKGQEDESMATIPATAGPASSRHRAPPHQRQHSPEVVDLLSDEDDEDYDDDDDDGEPGQPSKYFGAAGVNDPFQNQLETWEQRFADTANKINEPSPPRGRSTYNKKGGGGKKGFYKKAGGSSRGAGGRSYSGVSKRKSGGSTGSGASGRRTSGGSARSGGGGSSRSGASTVKRSGARGGGSGGSGIGIMPF